MHASTGSVLLLFHFSTSSEKAPNIISIVVGHKNYFSDALAPYILCNLFFCRIIFNEDPNV